MTEENFRAHLAALAPLLTMLDGRGTDSAGLTGDPDFDPEHARSLFSTIAAFSDTADDVPAVAPEKVTFNTKRFTYSKGIPDPTTTVLQGEEMQIFTDLKPSSNSAQRAHCLPNRPTTNNLVFRVKVRRGVSFGALLVFARVALTRFVCRSTSSWSPEWSTWSGGTSTTLPTSSNVRPLDSLL